MQRVFWIYLTNNFEAASAAATVELVPGIPCTFISITCANCERVAEFREGARVQEYRDKLSNKEIGFFAISNSRAVGSIWATVNQTSNARIARGYVRLLPNEALIHDIVTGAECRGFGVGPYMVHNILLSLFEAFALSKVIIDVNARNESSLRMMSKAGLRPQNTMLYVSALGTLVFSKELRRFPEGCSTTADRGRKRAEASRELK